MPLSQSQAPLPSFVELMESLGFAADSKLPQQSSDHEEMCSISRSPSASPPPPSAQNSELTTQVKREGSPTIIVSQYDNSGRETANESSGFKRRASAGNIKAARFSPYLSAVSVFSINLNLCTPLHILSSLFLLTKKPN